MHAVHKFHKCRVNLHREKCKKEREKGDYSSSLKRKRPEVSSVIY